MFWLTCIGFAMAWMLVKFGVLSSTVGILSLALKLAVVTLVVCTAIFGIWMLRRAAVRQTGDKAL